MMMRTVCFLCGVVLLVGYGTASAADFDRDVGTFFKQHCIDCHGEDLQEGEFRIDNLSKDVGRKDTALWAEVRERISSGEMPPEDLENRPSAEEGARVVEWLSARIKEGELARMAQRDRVSFYRLSREEYVNTVRDLLGVTFDAADPGGFSEDPEWHGFERVGSVLSLSASHVEKYIDAAEVILDEAYPDRPVTPITELKPAVHPSRVTEPYRSDLEARGLLDKVRYDLWPQDKNTHVRPGTLRAPGLYRARVRLSGLKPKNGRAPRLKVYHKRLDRVIFERDIVAPEDEPIVVEFTTHLPAGSHDIQLINDVDGPSNLPRSGRHGRKPFVSIADGRIPWQLKLTDEEGNALWPFLILDSVEWHGPIVTDEQARMRAEYMPETPAKGEEPDFAAVREALSKLARRAFRRPLRAGEIDPYVSLVRNELAAGAEFRPAMKTAMLAILCSKSFLFVVEGEGETDRQTLTDYELASRLSYFLWSTMPDAELFALADQNRLHEPDVLRAQVERMLADPRAKRFTTSFPTQWLRLKKVGMFPPDEKLYPEYDAHLEGSMIRETTAFFEEVLTERLTLREFLASDWTMLNERLALHYGIAGVEGDEFRRVSLPESEHRGGLLTQASILSLTSDGTRHRPVHRGVWVSESIFGKSPPPPPANVDAIEPTPSDQPKATLRMKLEAHRSNPSCASCHRKIDPLGLAFENFDAIGRWRTTEQVAKGRGADPEVDPSGELPDGRSFANADEFKRLLMTDLDRFSETFLEKLATYGLRRAITFEDHDEIAALTGQAREADYEVRAIVESFVLSDLFRRR